MLSTDVRHNERHATPQAESHMLIFETACEYILRHSAQVNAETLVTDFMELYSLVPLGAFFGTYITSPNYALFFRHQLGGFCASEDLRIRVRTITYGILDWAHTLPHSYRRNVWYMCLYSTCNLLNYLSHFTGMSDLDDPAFNDEVHMLRFILTLKVLHGDIPTSRVVRDIKITADVCAWSNLVTSFIIGNVENIRATFIRLCSLKTTDIYSGPAVNFQTPIKSCAGPSGIDDTITVLKIRNDKFELRATEILKPADDHKTPLLQDFAPAEDDLSEGIGSDNVFPSPPLRYMSQQQALTLDESDPLHTNEDLRIQKQACSLESALIWKSEEVSNKWNLPF